MKKLMSVLLSLVMVFAAAAVTTTAYAETVQSFETTAPQRKPSGTVNGKTSNDVFVLPDDDNDPTTITFQYRGDGELIGWTFPGMVQGVDYVILSQEGDTITIKIINDSYEGDIIANAIVEDATTTETTEPEEPTEEPTTGSDITTTTTTTQTTTKKSEVKKNKKNKSPKTGVSSATGVAALGVGAAVLLASRKKKDAE